MAQADEIEAKQKTKRTFQRPLQIAGAAAGAVTFFFVLKAFAFTQSDTALSRPVAAEAGIGATVFYWFAGADPITQTLAAAMRPKTTPASL